jgi:LysR family pca operon transcriptional activator
MLRVWDLSARQLRTFVTVVELGGVSRAAEQLHVTQPAVSKILRGIEQAVEAKLFEKRGRQLQLAPAGEVLYRHARAAMAEFIAGAAELDVLNENRADLLRLAAVPAAMATFLPKAIARLMQSRPAVQVILNNDAYYGIADILPAVAKGDVDLGITVFQEELSLGILVGEELFGDRLRLVARKDHLLARQDRVEIPQLMDELVVLPPLEAIAGQILVQEFSAEGLPFPPRRITAASREVTFGLVQECNAVAFLTGHPVCEDRYQGDFVDLPMRFRQPIPWKISLCRRASSEPSPVMAEFMAILREMVREAEAREPLTR